MGRRNKSAPPRVSADAPKLTKESFERELQDLAAKAKEQTWAKWAREQSWVLIRSGILLTLTAIYSNVSQLTLSPVFGSIPASVWHPKGVLVACFLGWSSNLFLSSTLPYEPVKLLPVLAAYIPLAQFALFKYSGFLGGNYGPLVIESVTFFPLLVLSVSSTATILDDLEMRPGVYHWIADAAPGILSYTFYRTMENFSRIKLQEMIGASFFQTRLGLQLCLTGLYSISAPSKLLFYTIPPLIHTLVFNVHVPAPWTTDRLNSTMNANGWSLVARQESLTGYISVIDNMNVGYRAMRCDHSLLGGEWQLSATKTKTKEPIYSIFVMLEAVRLVEVPISVPDEEANALVVGLGIGTTPAALIAHGVDTTIVEIDPVVYDFATRYFDLPANHTAVISDAVSYASLLVGLGKKFDYIVHDVFTGGAEPIDLFTFEFLSNLHSLLTPDGVIAINYAGDILLPSARIVIHTVVSIFPTCRIYRELVPPSESTLAEEGRDFTNMVIFCTNSPNGTITFKKPDQRDYLHSNARRKFLVPEHEISREEFAPRESDGGILRWNNTKRIEAWQQMSAVGHWEVMRTVLPDVIWQNW